jgi:protein-disulfide isomerase
MILAINEPIVNKGIEMIILNNPVIKRRQLLKTSALGALTVGTSSLVSSGVLAQESALGEKVEGLYEKLSLEEQVLGSADAPITMIEYASMTCGHCANFHINILPAIKEKFIETGKVKLLFREFPFDPLATAAFMLARCAPGGKYFEMVDVLFTQQQIWASSDDPAAALLKLARLAGFTKESFETCLRDEELLKNINVVKERAVQKFEVAATPTFFINEQRYKGDYTVDGFSKTFAALGA